ncbi:MAG: mevalonate kinase family protein [Flavobacteriales bacterium]
MTVVASAPGRICLFGEHQDYLGLPVTAAAINLICRVELTLNPGSQVVMNLPDGRPDLCFDLTGLPDLSPRNYGLSVLRLAQEEGWLPPTGFHMRFRTHIPMASGTSSSTAWVLTMVAVISRAAGIQFSPMEIAQKAHHAEVIAFQEPGGQMDHISCALGGMRSIGFEPVFQTSLIGPPSGMAWVLGDSLQPKNTLDTLHRVKTAREQLFRRMPKDFELASASAIPAPASGPPWTTEEFNLLRATFKNRDLSAAGTEALKQGDVMAVGDCLSAHHGVLRDAFGLSTHRIEDMLSRAQNAGAIGGKINGSGGGGCCFVLCHQPDEAKVVQAMNAAGGRGIPIRILPRGVTTEISTA